MAASDIIRVSLVLEKGKLAMPVKERGKTSGPALAPPAPKPSTPPPVPPKPPSAAEEEDVPF